MSPETAAACARFDAIMERMRMSTARLRASTRRLKSETDKLAELL